MENLNAIGLELPSWVTMYFNRMREDYDERLGEKIAKEKFEVEITKQITKEDK